jgi:hypothetical protein
MADAMTDRATGTAWWRRKLFWGVLVSVFLGAVSLFFEGVDGDVKLAVLIALLGIALTVVVELRLQSEESAEEFRSRLEGLHEAQRAFDQHIQRFTAYADAPAPCQELIADIADDWRRIDERSSVFLNWLRHDAEREFRARLHELGSGHGTVDRHSRHHFRTHPLIDFARIRSVDATLTNYWNTGSGRRYLESQRTGIEENGLEVSRVFVLSRDRIPGAREIVRRHVRAGIAVSIVVREEIEADPEVPELEDLSLVTDRSGVTGVLKPRSAGEPEIFTAEERRVAHAEEVVEFLTQYARSVDAVYRGSA